MDKSKTDQPENEPNKNNSTEDQTLTDKTSDKDADNFGGSTSPAELPGTVISGDNAPDKPSKHKGDGLLKNKKALVMVGVAALIVLAGGYYFMNKDSDKPANTASSAVVKKEITLMRFGSQNGMADTFYPDADSTSLVSSTTIQRAIFEGLVAYGSNGHFDPLLATSWTNPDSNTWVFKLKQGVKFHDGNTMTAQIVKDSILAPTPNADLYSISDIIKSIDIVDAQTIKITTSSPDALLLNRLVAMYIFDTTNKTTNNPVNGTGPFMVKEGTKPSYDAIDLVQFPDYHGDKPLVKEVVGKSYEDDDAIVKAAKAGQIDVGFTFFQNQAQDILSTKSADYKFVRVDAAGAYNLYPLTFKTGSPIQNKDIRKAIYLTLDPNAIKVAAEKDGDPIGQIAPKTVPGYDPSIIRPKQDIEAAKALVKTAYPNGVTLSAFYGPPADKTVKEMGKELAAIGITLTYHPVQSFQEYVSNIKTNKYDLAYISSYSDIGEVSDLISQSFTKDGFIGTYDNADVNKLLAQATAEFDTAKRIKLLQQASSKLMDDVAAIPVFSPTSQVLLRKNYTAAFDINDGQFGAYLASFYAL